MFTASHQQGATEKLWPHFFFTSVASGVLFCKSRSGSACLDAPGSRSRAPLDALPQSQRREVRRESGVFIILLVYPEKTGLSTNARCCTSLEFSSGEINTMWPCRGSNCPIWESLLIQDLRMGKLQSKHGKKAANSCWNKQRLTNQLWFDCITRAKEIICQKNNIICVLHLSSWRDRSV